MLTSNIKFQNFKISQFNKNNNNDSTDIKKVLQIDETQESIDESSDGENKNLEQSILEKISD